MNEQKTVSDKETYSKKGGQSYMSFLVGLSAILGIPLPIRMIVKADFFSPLFFLPCAPLAFCLLGLFMVLGDMIRTTGIVIYSIL